MARCSTCRESCETARRVELAGKAFEATAESADVLVAVVWLAGRAHQLRVADDNDVQAVLAHSDLAGVRTQLKVRQIRLTERKEPRRAGGLDSGQQRWPVAVAQSRALDAVVRGVGLRGEVGLRELRLPHLRRSLQAAVARAPRCLAEEM